MASMRKALMAGLAGTVVMTVFSFMTHYFNLPQFDLQRMIADHLPVGGFFPWMVYFGLGVLFAFAFGYMRDRLPSDAIRGGAMFAVFLWVMAGVVAMTLGMGFFYGSAMAAVSAFVGMELYGLTVSYLYEH